jgi:hypothetical protein
VLNLTLGQSEDNLVLEDFGVVFDITLNNGETLNENTFFVDGAVRENRHRITSRFPAPPSECQDPARVLMEFRVQWNGGGPPLHVLKSAENVLQREQLFISVLGHETRCMMHASEHPTWWRFDG